MDSNLLTLITERYPSASRRLLPPLLELLAVSRAICGGDAEKLLVILAVGIRTVEHPDFAKYSQAELLSGEIPIFPSLGLNVRSIADSVGMPRESARRKVAELVDAGWFERRGRAIHFTARGYQDLAPVREAIERLAVENFETVRALVKEG